MANSITDANKTTWWLLRILLLAYAFNSFSLITADNDLWGHVTFGGQIWSAKALPETNGYAYTAEHHPWYNHEWLTEVIFFLTYSLAGSTGLLVLKMAVGLMGVALLSSLYLRQERNVLVYLFYFFLLIPVMAPGFMIRPHIFSFLFLALLMALLQYFYDGRKKAIYWTPLLMLAWVNCHGGVLAGIGIFGVVAMAEWMRCRFTGGREGNTLLLFFTLSCLAMFANPHGYKLWTFFYESLSIPRPITEWAGVNLWNRSYLEFKILSGLFFLTLFLPIRKRLWEVLIGAIAIVYAFKHQRHTVLAAVAMTPFLPVALTQLVNRYTPTLSRDACKPVLIRALQGLLVLMIGANLYLGVKKNALNNYRVLVEPRVYPSYVVQFMKANGIQGNIWVPFDWGEYLIWKLPQSKVSVDGRFRTAYPNSVLEDYKSLLEGRPGWQAILNKYPTDYILTRRKENTHLLLDGHPDWVKIYGDPIAFLYVRKTDPPGAIESLFRQQRLINPQEPVSLDFP